MSKTREIPMGNSEISIAREMRKRFNEREVKSKREDAQWEIARWAEKRCWCTRRVCYQGRDLLITAIGAFKCNNNGGKWCNQSGLDDIQKGRNSIEFKVLVLPTSHLVARHQIFWRPRTRGDILLAAPTNTYPWCHLAHLIHIQCLFAYLEKSPPRRGKMEHISLCKTPRESPDQVLWTAITKVVQTNVQNAKSPPGKWKWTQIQTQCWSKIEIRIWKPNEHILSQLRKRGFQHVFYMDLLTGYHTHDALRLRFGPTELAMSSSRWN